MAGDGGSDTSAGSVMTRKESKLVDVRLGLRRISYSVRLQDAISVDCLVGGSTKDLPSCISESESSPVSLS